MILRLGMLAFLLVFVPGASQAGNDAYQTRDPNSTETDVSKEMEIARFYIGKRHYTGAINRCKVVVTHFPASRQVQEALMLLVEMYLALDIPKEAQTAAAVLKRKFPDSGWTHIAVEILKSAGLEPDEDENSPISRAVK